MNELNATEPSARAGSADRESDAHKIIRYHVVGAVGVSLLPMPLADLALLTGVQLSMIRFLAIIYEVSFSADLAKSLVASVISGTLPATPASLLKSIPGIGAIAGALGFTAAAGASTYALGKVFVQHFESGGTFLTLDPSKVRAYYAEQCAKGAVQSVQDYSGIKP